MTNFRDGGLKHEASISYGDSGSGALYEKDGELYAIGVCSHLYASNDE